MASFPTSYIPTEGSTVTRAADVASISGSNFSSWYRQDEGTVFAEASSPGNSNTIAALSDGTNTNRILFDHGTNSRRLIVTDSSVSQAIVATSYSYGSMQKSAVAFAEDSFQISLAGVLGTIDTSGTVPVVSEFYVGSNAVGQLQLSSTIKRLTYWPQRLPDSTLQTITQ